MLRYPSVFLVPFTVQCVRAASMLRRAMRAQRIRQSNVPPSPLPFLVRLFPHLVVISRFARGFTLGALVAVTAAKTAAALEPGESAEGFDDTGAEVVVCGAVVRGAGCGRGVGVLGLEGGVPADVGG